MLNNEQKAILMTLDMPVRHKIEDYLLHHFNWKVEMADGIIEVLNYIAGDSHYELIILDERIAGLPATSHTLRTIKTQSSSTNVLYLSTLLEFLGENADLNNREGKNNGYKGYKVENENHEEQELPEEISSEVQTSDRLEKLMALCQPIMKSLTLDDIYQSVCKNLVDFMDVDRAICVILRLDEKPVTRGVIVGDYPEGFPPLSEVNIEGIQRVDELIRYFKPIHIPDIYEDMPFFNELDKKFLRFFRSALILPIQFDGNCIGFLGLFTGENSRLFRVDEIDLCQKLADITAAAIITIYAIQNQKLKIKNFNNEFDF